MAAFGTLNMLFLGFETAKYTLGAKPEAVLRFHLTKDLNS